MNQDHQKFLQILEETELLESVCKDISKLIADLAIGDVHNCKFCKKTIVVLKSDNNSHESYQFNENADEYVCAECAYSVIRCAMCKSWEIYNILFVPVQRCCNRVHPNLAHLCVVCNRGVQTTYQHICYKCIKLLQNPHPTHQYDDLQTSLPHSIWTINSLNPFDSNLFG